MRIIVHLTDAAREYAYDRASCFSRNTAPPRATISSAFSRSDISAGVFIPWRGGTDESGAAKFLLDLLGPPDGEVAAACRCRFLFSDYDWRWRSGGGVMVPAPARGRGSNWRRPDRDNWAVGLFGVLSLRHFGWSFYPLARGYRRIRRGEVFARPARAA
jgi:hypothetical protein